MKRVVISRSLIGAAVIVTSLAIVSCGGGDAPPVIGGPLFTSAPSQVTLDAGTVVSYRLNGGNFPYMAASGNSNVARVTTDGLNLTVTAVSSGTAPITVSDATGARISFNVTVSAQGSTGTPLSLTPGTLTVGNCTSRIPFLFTGGTAPYTVFTSDVFGVPVSSPLPLSDGRYYFFADARVSPADLNLQEGAEGARMATLTVLDSQSRKAEAKLDIKVNSDCFPNPVLVVSPESANFRTSELIAFNIIGGASAVAPLVRFTDAGVVELVSVTPTTVTIRAVTATPASTLMTIESQGADRQRAVIPLNVLPQP